MNKEKMMAVIALVALASVFCIFASTDSDGAGEQEIIYGDSTNPTLFSKFEVGRTYCDVPVAYGWSYMGEIPGMKFSIKEVDGMNMITVSGTPTMGVGMMLTVYDENGSAYYVYLQSLFSDEYQYDVDPTQSDAYHYYVLVGSTYDFLILDYPSTMPSNLHGMTWQVGPYLNRICLRCSGTPTSAGEITYTSASERSVSVTVLETEPIATSISLTGSSTVTDLGSTELHANTIPLGSFAKIRSEITAGSSYLSVDTEEHSGYSDFTVNGIAQGNATIKFTAVPYYDIYVLKNMTVIPASSQIYTITYAADGGANMPSSANYLGGQEITLPVQGTKSNCYLSGWRVGTGVVLEPGASYVVTRDMTLTAVWSPVPDNCYTSAPNTCEPGVLYSTSYVHSNHILTAITINEKPDWMNISFGPHTVSFSGTPEHEGVYVVDVDAKAKRSYHQGSTNQTVASIWWYIVVSSDAVTYKVTYLPNGAGGDSVQIDYAANTAITLLGSDNVYTMDGYTQIGWTTEDNYGVNVMYFLGSNFVVDRNVVFLAQWWADPHVIVLDANGGTMSSGYPVDAVIAYTNQTYDIPGFNGTPKAGYTFGGWQENVDSGVYAAGYKIPSIVNSMYLKANWVKGTYYTITFKANGPITGDLTALIDGTMNPNGSYRVIMPTEANYVMAGYELIGWSTNRDASPTDELYEPGSVATFTANTTLYAIWSEESPQTDRYTVYFHLNGGQGNISSQTVLAGGKVTKPINPTRETYIFDNIEPNTSGWKEQNGYVWDFNNTVDHTMNLYAQWKQLFQVTKTNMDVSVKILSPFNGSQVSVNWGDGHSTEPQFSSTFNYTYTSTTQRTITVTVNYMGNTYTSTATVTPTLAPQSDPVIIIRVTPNESGTVFRFDASESLRCTAWKWYVDGQLLPYNTQVISFRISDLSDQTGTHTMKLVVNNDQRFYKEVQFIVTEEEYLVQFDLNGGTGTAPDQTIKENGTVTKPANPTKTGYVFVGWYLNGQPYDFNTIVKSSFTLIAIWDDFVTESVDGMTVKLTFSPTYRSSTIMIKWDADVSDTETSFHGDEAYKTYTVEGSHKIIVSTAVSSSENISKTIIVSVSPDAPPAPPTPVEVKVTPNKVNENIWEFDASESTGVTSYLWMVNGHEDKEQTGSKYVLTLQPGVKYVVTLICNENTKYTWTSDEITTETGSESSYIVPAIVVIVGLIATAVLFNVAPIYMRYSIVVAIAGLIWLAGVYFNVF